MQKFSVRFEMNNGKSYATIFIAKDKIEFEKQLKQFLRQPDFSDLSYSFVIKDQEHLNAFINPNNISSIIFEEVTRIPIISFEKFLDLNEDILNEFFLKFNDFTTVGQAFIHRDVSKMNKVFSETHIKFMKNLKKTEINNISPDIVIENENKILYAFEKMYLAKELAITLDNCYSID